MNKIYFFKKSIAKPTGATKALIDIVNELSMNKFNVTIIILSNDEPYFYLHENVEIISLGYTEHLLLARLRLRRPLNMYIKDGVNGFLATNEPSVWANKIRFIYNSCEANIKHISDASIQFINESYNTQKNVQSYQEKFATL